MPYTLEDCSLYSKTRIKSIPIYIFESHNMALPVWGTYAAQTGPLNLFTFDTHPDTQPAFSKLTHGKYGTSIWDYKKMMNTIEVKSRLKNLHYRQEDFCFEDVFRYYDTILNTEQILTGVLFGYISSYTVRCHLKKSDLAIDYEKRDQELGYNATYIGDDDDRKPSVRTPLILDIDLDYFRSKQEMNHLFVECVKPIFENAVAITIAREPKFFNGVRLDDSFTVEEAESTLLNLLNAI